MGIFFFFKVQIKRKIKNNRKTCNPLGGRWGQNFQKGPARSNRIRQSPVVGPTATRKKMIKLSWPTHHFIENGAHCVPPENQQLHQPALSSCIAAVPCHFPLVVSWFSRDPNVTPHYIYIYIYYYIRYTFLIILFPLSYLFIYFLRVFSFNN